MILEEPTSEFCLLDFAQRFCTPFRSLQASATLESVEQDAPQSAKYIPHELWILV